jgi:hypothetical protein
MTREEIITAMCYAWRHDYGYGLDVREDHTGILTSGGITPEERKFIWNQMAQIYDIVIAPNMIFKEQILKGSGGKYSDIISDGGMDPRDRFRGCRVCGIGANGEAIGYVCNRGDCPTRITFT